MANVVYCKSSYIQILVLNIRSVNPFGSWWENCVQPVRRGRTSGEAAIRPRN